MNFVDVFLQILSVGKWFATKFTFVIFVAFMNCVDMILQMACFRKWFTTRFTFVIFVAFMNCVDMSLQISCQRKLFITRITVVSLVAFMNYMNVFFQTLCSICGLRDIQIHFLFFIEKDKAFNPVSSKWNLCLSRTQQHLVVHNNNLTFDGLFFL